MRGLNVGGCLVLQDDVILNKDIASLVPIIPIPL